MNDYELKQELRRTRLEKAADALSRKGQASIDKGMDRLSAIPFGQPILVGHHSEKRDRNYRRKAAASIDRGFELKKAADDLAAKAAAVGNGGISSDDPDAVTKLNAKLKDLEHAQSRMREINSAWRKVGRPAASDSAGWGQVATLAAIGENDALAIRKSMATDPLGRGPFPTYATENNAANIRRVKERIAALTRHQERTTKEHELPGGIRILENAEANRLQIFFPGKPGPVARESLKRFGFRWSPSEGAWQRHLSNSALYWAHEIVKTLGVE